MIRPLFVIDTLERGGAEFSLLSVASRLDRSEFDPIVCHVYPGNTLAEDFERASVKVLSLNIRKKYGFVGAVRRLIDVIRTERVDLVHTSLFRAGQAGRIAAWRTKTPVVSTFSGVPYDASRVRNDHSVRRWKLGLLRRMDSLTGRLVTRFHGVSDVVRDCNCRDLGISPDRVSVIPRGRELSEFARPPADVINRIRLSPEFAGAESVVLNVGRLVPAKGQSLLIDAMTHVRERQPEIRLLIAGDGPLRSELEQQIQSHSLEHNVRLLGARNDVAHLLHAADVFAFSSRHEGLPGALIEAMISGRPCIASDIPMHSELVRHEQTGLLVPGDDSQAMAAAIIRLVQNRSEAGRLAAAAQQFAAGTFDINDVVRRMQGLYFDILPEQRAADPMKPADSAGSGGPHSVTEREGLTIQ